MTHDDIIPNANVQLLTDEHDIPMYVRATWRDKEPEDFADFVDVAPRCLSADCRLQAAGLYRDKAAVEILQ